MATHRENNNGLYFTVGALLIIVLVLGFLFIGGNDDVTTIEPSAGMEEGFEENNVGDDAIGNEETGMDSGDSDFSNSQNLDQ